MAALSLVEAATHPGALQRVGVLVMGQLFTKWPLRYCDHVQTLNTVLPYGTGHFDPKSNAYKHVLSEHAPLRPAEVAVVNALSLWNIRDQLKSKDTMVIAPDGIEVPDHVTGGARWFLQDRLSLLMKHHDLDGVCGVLDPYNLDEAFTIQGVMRDGRLQQRALLHIMKEHPKRLAGTAAYAASCKWTMRTPVDTQALRWFRES